MRDRDDTCMPGEEGPGAEGRVHFVTVSFFGADTVARLVDSLITGSDPRWSMVIVDNSSDELQARLLSDIGRSDPRVEIQHSEFNLGYFGGARWAIRGGVPPDWIVVSNADLTFEPDFVAILQSRRPHGVIAPRIRSSISGLDQNPYLAKRPTPRRARLWQIQFRWVPVARASIVLTASAGRLRRRMRRPDVDVPQARRIYAGHGSCIVISREFFDRGGSLEHGTFLFGEEISIGEECRRASVPVTYDPVLGVKHQEHSSTGVWRSREMIMWQRESVTHVRALLRGRTDRRRS